MKAYTYKKTMLALLSCLYGPIATAEVESLPNIEVKTNTETLQEKTFSPENLNNIGSTETGSLLRQINGVDASRMGGHGLEPIIRGQSKGQLNILLDGATIHSGCPNRMDPPTSYSEINSYDNITVIKGVASVENGAGGSGGTISFKRNKPKYNPNKMVSGSIAILKSNVINIDSNANLKAVAEQGYLSIQANKKQGNNYENGNGDKVGASFKTIQGHIYLGWTPSDNHHLKVSHEISNTADAIFPGANMDSPKSDATISRLAYEGKNINFSAYQSKVEHQMNNFDLRKPPTLPNKKRENLTETLTTGGKLKLTSNIGKSKLKYGVQIEDVNHDATLYNRGNDKSIFLMWPDVTTTVNSLFIEADTDFDSVKLTTSLRYDDVSAKASKANQLTQSMKKASSLYTNAYADYNGDNQANESNISGLIRATGELANLNWFTGLSHTKRTASATERFIAKGGNTSSGAQNHWVGNPNIKPEQHNQFDIGISQKSKNIDWQVSVWFDQVNNYILRDLAKNQYHNGIKATAKEASEVYVNVGAELFGTDASASWYAAENMKVSGQLSFVDGKNTTDNRNISSLSPINGNLATEYYLDQYTIGARFNFALEQTNLDKDYTPTSSFGKTPAWSTFDIFAEAEITKNWLIKAGVDNLFSHDYYQAVNRGTLGESYKLNEPGRNIWVNIAAKF